MFTILSPLRPRLAVALSYITPQFTRSRSQLAPRKVKWLKRHKGRVPIPIGGSVKGTTLAFGDYGLRIRGDGARLSAKQLQTAEDAIKRKLKIIKGARLHLRVFPDIPVCVKGNETRMGKGKGPFEYWACRVPTGRVLFELESGDSGLIREEVAKSIFRLAQAKLPVLTDVITRAHGPRLGNIDLPRLSTDQKANYSPTATSHIPSTVVTPCENLHCMLVHTLHLADVSTGKLFKVLSLEQPVTLGRRSGGSQYEIYNGLFESAAMSRKHAMVWQRKGRIYICDTRSAQGTFLNGNRISEARVRLMQDDVVEFGIDFQDPQRGDFKAIKLKVVACPTADKDACRCALAFGPTFSLGPGGSVAGLDDTLANIRKVKLDPLAKPTGSYKGSTQKDVSAEPIIAASEPNRPPISRKAPLHYTFERPDEFGLLDVDYPAERPNEQELSTAPVFTGDALDSGLLNVVQFGLLGRVISIRSSDREEPHDDPRLYINTNAPFSAIICGVQGSGKSHTVGTLLENMLVAGDSRLGFLSRPLSGLVLHFGQGGSLAKPCEAAYQGLASHPKTKTPAVRVFVSPSSLNSMRILYAPLGSNVVVDPLTFSESELDVQAILAMTTAGSNSEPIPPHAQIVLAILRQLGEEYTFQSFVDQLEDKKKSVHPSQLVVVEQKIALLISFLRRSEWGSPSSSRFAAGQLTIIDLSDPFIDTASACGLFEIVIRQFVRADVGTGKFLIADEAHKYLTSKSSLDLTKSLLSLVRQQRHLAMRVIISTQEPTVIPVVLLELSTVIVFHRFSSPAWWTHVARHISSEFAEDGFEQVVNLQAGEAIVLSPSGLGMFSGPTGRTLQHFGRRYAIVKIRQKITADGGSSVLVIKSGFHGHGL